jgi:hypothetical protein
MAVALAALVAAQPAADARCRSTCTDELRACRTQCAPLRGVDRRQCRGRCADTSTCAAPGAPVPTLAYSVNECTEDAQGLLTIAQKLVVRRGNCDPVTIMTTVAQLQDPLPAGYGSCRNYGRIRIGFLSAPVGRFQRVGVLANGSGVVFEVASYPVLEGLALPPSPEDGLYFVRAGDTRPRKLGPPLGFGFLELVRENFGPLPFTLDQTDSASFAASPDGHRIAFTALVPDPRGIAVRQIVVLDVKSGTRTQVTHFPPSPPGAKGTCCPLFVNDRTLIFFDGVSGKLSTVSADGSDMPQPIPAIDAVAGATVIPQFGIFSGRSGNAYPLVVPGDLERSYNPSDRRRELFFLQGIRALQLTDLRYPDTGWAATLGIDRVTFSASADPIPGSNPFGVCQLFSVPARGGPLRQLTRFPDDGLQKQGCGVPTVFDASCRVNALFQDLRTRTVLFVSSCDPLGRTRHGEQVFTMRPDGTGLRQLTDFAGLETRPDGSVHVEMGGPYATSAALR